MLNNYGTTCCDELKIDMDDIIRTATMYHNELKNLDYETSGHTGFASSKQLEALRNEKGQPNGIATLDGSGKIPLEQIPNGKIILKGSIDNIVENEFTPGADFFKSILSFDNATLNIDFNNYKDVLTLDKLKDVIVELTLNINNSTSGQSVITSPITLYYLPSANGFSAVDYGEQTQSFKTSFSFSLTNNYQLLPLLIPFYKIATIDDTNRETSLESLSKYTLNSSIGIYYDETTKTFSAKMGIKPTIIMPYEDKIEIDIQPADWAKLYTTSEIELTNTLSDEIKAQIFENPNKDILVNFIYHKDLNPDLPQIVHPKYFRQIVLRPLGNSVGEMLFPIKDTVINGWFSEPYNDIDWVDPNTKILNLKQWKFEVVDSLIDGSYVVPIYKLSFVDAIQTQPLRNIHILNPKDDTATEDNALYRHTKQVLNYDPAWANSLFVSMYKESVDNIYLKYPDKYFSRRDKTTTPIIYNRNLISRYSIGGQLLGNKNVFGEEENYLNDNLLNHNLKGKWKLKNNINWNTTKLGQYVDTQELNKEYVLPIIADNRTENNVNILLISLTKTNNGYTSKIYKKESNSGVDGQHLDLTIDYTTQNITNEIFEIDNCVCSLETLIAFREYFDYIVDNDLTNFITIDSNLTSGTITQMGYDELSKHNIFFYKKNGKMLVFRKESTSPTFDLETVYYENQKYYIVKFTIKSNLTIDISGFNLVDEIELQNKINELSTTLNNIISSHISNKNNPHNVTKEQVGLSNVDNTSDINKPISTLTQKELDKKANIVDVYNKKEVDDKDTNILNSAKEYTNTSKSESLQESKTYIDTQITNLNNLKVDKTTTINNYKLDKNINLTKNDIGLSNVDNTSDSAIPVQGGTTKFTTGGAFTELAKKQDNLTQEQIKITKMQIVEDKSTGDITITIPDTI